jgi:hypothetical protein
MPDRSLSDNESVEANGRCVVDELSVTMVEEEGLCTTVRTDRREVGQEEEEEKVEENRAGVV